MTANNFLAGVVTGAGLAFLADPTSGRRRRALVRDQLVHASRKTRDAADATARDLANRTRGVVMATKSRLNDGWTDDARLVERVRAKLGRVCSQPRAIEVSATDGIVTLYGAVLADEADAIVAAAFAAPGVASVADRLERHQHADELPAVHEEQMLSDPSIEAFEENWAPATTVLVAGAVLGIAAALFGRRLYK